MPFGPKNKMFALRMIGTFHKVYPSTFIQPDAAAEYHEPPGSLALLHPPGQLRGERAPHGSGRHAQEFLAGQGIVAKTSQHPAGDEVGAGLVYAAGGHAVMHSLDNHADALRLENVVDRVGDLRGHLFLDLQAPGVDVHHAGQLGDADHAAVWNVSNPGPPDDRRHVMLAMAFEADVPQHDHFIVAFGFLKSLFQDFYRVLAVASEKLLERPGHARRGLDQAVTFRVFPRPSDDGSHRGLDFGSARLLNLRLRRSCAIQCVYIWAHNHAPR